jgi:WXG100 family type VII secretion target
MADIRATGDGAGFRAATAWVTLREAREEFRMATAAPTEDMQRAAARFAYAVEAARSRLRDVNSEMAVTQASWRGEASVRLGQAMSDWEQEFDVILSRLAGLLEATGGPMPRPRRP